MGPSRPAREGARERLRPVLPGVQGDGAAGRALDDAGRPRARAGQPALQRAAPGRAPDVAGAAVQAPAHPRPGRGGRAARRRPPGHLRPHRGRAGAAADRGGPGPLGRPLDPRAGRRGPRPAPAAVGHAPQRRPAGGARGPHRAPVQLLRRARAGPQLVDADHPRQRRPVRLRPRLPGVRLRRGRPAHPQHGLAWRPGLGRGAAQRPGRGQRPAPVPQQRPPVARPVHVLFRPAPGGCRQLSGVTSCVTPTPVPGAA